MFHQAFSCFSRHRATLTGVLSDRRWLVVGLIVAVFAFGTAAHVVYAVSPQLLLISKSTRTEVTILLVSFLLVVVVSVSVSVSVSVLLLPLAAAVATYRRIQNIAIESINQFLRVTDPLSRRARSCGASCSQPRWPASRSWRCAATALASTTAVTFLSLQRERRIEGAPTVPLMIGIPPRGVGCLHAHPDPGGVMIFNIIGLIPSGLQALFWGPPVVLAGTKMHVHHWFYSWFLAAGMHADTTQHPPRPPPAEVVPTEQKKRPLPEAWPAAFSPAFACPSPERRRWCPHQPT